MVNCWAEKLGNCSKKQSKEHLISKGILKGDEHHEPEIITIWGFNWCRDKPNKVSVSSFASKILCEYHNNLLSQVDSEAMNLYDILGELQLMIRNPPTTSMNKTINRTINGRILERWFLKTAINVIYSDWGIDKPPIELVELAFGLKSFPINVGLCLANSFRLPMQDYEDGIKLTPIMKDYNTFSAILFEFRGWKFALSLTNKPLPTSLNTIDHIPFSYMPVDTFIQEFLKSQLIYHVSQVEMPIDDKTKYCIHFDWQSSENTMPNASLNGWQSNKIPMFYTNPVAIDAEDNRVMCSIELDKRNKKLKIVIPQDFLDRAKYPVEIIHGFYPRREEALNFYERMKSKKAR